MQATPTLTPDTVVSNGAEDSFVTYALSKQAEGPPFATARGPLLRNRNSEL